jgi:Predicted kinase
VATDKGTPEGSREGGRGMSMNIFVGNIGSGKSVVARKLAFQGAAVFNMDSFQQMIAGGEYGAYDVAKKDIYQEAENLTIRKALEAGLSVVVDRTNMDRKRRERFIKIGQEFGAHIVAYDWGMGTPNNVLRRMKAPRGIPMQQWQDVYGTMLRSYEPPCIEEGIDEIIIPPAKYRFHAFDFDGTIIENKFPDIGAILDGTVEKMSRIYDDLSNIIIVWTCRDEDYTSQMRQFLLKNRIPFDFINENPIFDTGSRKIFAHKYYDDRGETL